MSVEITTLPSGLRIATDRMAHLETASLGVFVGAGSRHERTNEHGLSHLLEHMAFKGTRRRSARDIAEEIETVGGDLNAATSTEHTAYYAHVLAGDVPLALDILADILTESTFDSLELEREKGVILQEIGAVEPGASDLPGMEISGQIVALGPKVSGLSVGDKITSLLPGGGYAAYAIAAAPLCMPIPEGLSMVEAAAIPETFMTVWTNLFERGGCKAGDVVLIHGGTSGIGTTAIQLAAVWGARVFATAGSEEKARACEKLGAVLGIDYRTQDFVEVDACANRRVWNRHHVGHGRRQLRTAQPGYRGRRRARGHHFAAGRFAGGDRHGDDSDQAADADRFDTALPNHRAEGGGCRCSAAQCSPSGRGPGATGDLRHVSAGRGERSASAHGDFEAYRQDRAHRLGDPSGFTANKRTRLSDSD